MPRFIVVVGVTSEGFIVDTDGQSGADFGPVVAVCKDKATALAVAAFMNG